jgi:hypothetical protein
LFHLKVFYLDFGKLEVISIKQVYPMKQAFLNAPFSYCLFEHDFSFDLCKLSKKLIKEIFYQLNQETIFNIGYISNKEVEKTIPKIKIFVHFNDTNEILMLNDFVKSYVQDEEMIKN